VRGIQPGGPPGGETDPRALRAMEQRRRGLNLPRGAPVEPTPPERSQGPQTPMGEHAVTVLSNPEDAGSRCASGGSHH
jgi:hypothetical protein